MRESGSADPVSVDQLLAEATHLPPLDDPELDALRWAILVEDVLGVILSDEQITPAVCGDPTHLRALVGLSPPVP